MLGHPAEIYIYGAQYWFVNLGGTLAVILVLQLCVPVFSNLRVLSGYEYLEHRFKSRAVRLFGSFLGIMLNAWYMGAVLFGPATALQAVTGFPFWNSLFVVAAAAIFYTTVGGIKAVIWADAFQFTIMLSGMFALIITGTMVVGGIRKVWQIADEGGRLNFFNFSFDPTVRHTFWALIIGGGIRGMAIGTNQTTVQRIATMPTLRKAKFIVLLSIPGFVFFGTMAIVEGIIAYSYYRSIGCDPLEAKLIDNPNQVLPLFVMHAFKGLPGLPGLFIASLFSASLSTLSSGLNSLCTLVWTDFIKPHSRPISEFKATLIAKGLVILFGIVMVGLALLIMNIEGPIGQLTMGLTSVFSGPLVGIFLLGAFFYQATAKGALVGSVVSAGFCIWMAMGAIFSSLYRKTSYLAPSSTDNCFASNSSTIAGHLMNVTSQHYSSEANQFALTTATAASEQARLSGLAAFYSISSLWFGAFGIFSTVILGLIVSFLTDLTMPRSSVFKLHPHLAGVGIDRFQNALTINFQKKLHRSTSSNSDSPFDGQDWLKKFKSDITDCPFSAKGPNKREDVDPEFLVPIFDRHSCCLPESVRARLRCGIDYSTVKRKDEEPDEKVFPAKESFLKGDVIFVTESKSQSGYTAVATEDETESGNNAENHTNIDQV